MFLEKRKIIIMIIITIIAIISLFTFSAAKEEESTKDNIVKVEEKNTDEDIVKVEYEYDEKENTAIAKIISKTELKNTKPTWTLSENKKEYTKKFIGNTNYTTQVEDINGNIYNVNIVVTQIQPLSIKMDYEYNAEENVVIAKMTSNIELKNTKPSWTLSENKKEYTKRFTGNTNYTTQVEDVNGSVYNVNIVVTQIQPLSIKVDYEYDAEENTVTAKMISNSELKDNKPSWTLSENKREYTKTFVQNMSYSTSVEDINGRILEVNIDITQIKQLEIKVQYDYNKETNTVTVTMISKRKLKDTKPSWTLSDDKLTYTKVFTDNMDYSTAVEDLNGNKTDVNIEINQIEALKVEMEYSYNPENNTVTAKMISNTELKDTKPSWSLSDNKREYTKTFLENISYSTTVEDINGKVISVTINVTDVIIANLDVKYEYDKTTNKVTVKVISDLELEDTKPSWTLSDDKLIYIKEFTDNMDYSTIFIDSYGNNINVNIKVTQIDKTGPQITLEYRYESNSNVTITMKSNEPLRDTRGSWNLSQDKLLYTRVFSTDQDYSTTVEDIYGNSTNVYIKLKKKQYDYQLSDNSHIIVGYMYTSYNNVIVSIISNVPLKDTKPSWNLEDGGYRYTKIFNDDTEYTTSVVNVNGASVDVLISIDYFFTIIQEIGTYGYSGAALNGVAGGSSLEYLRFGNGNNVMFATFCVHGFEDSWSRDGEALVTVANNFYNRLVNDKDKELAKKWTIYIIREINPDGRRLGYTNNGPGRTTLYSSIGRGIDINRSWQTGSSFKRYTDSRNYNGTAGFQAYEAAYLRDFLLSHKSQGGQTVLVDLHGWENQLIGDSGICNYYKQQYPSCSTRNYGVYGTQYLISWARQNLGARTALIELPKVNSMAEFNSAGFSEKYINATLNMLRGI